MTVCPLCRGSGFYATRTIPIRCPLCRGNRQVDDETGRIYARRPFLLRRKIRRGIEQETRLAGLERGDEPADPTRPSRALLGIVVIAWLAYEVWTAIRFARTPSSKRPQDFIGTWVVVSGLFVAGVAIALRIPADAVERWRSGRSGRDKKS